jgi:2-methylcitrate dehydratase PrpD
MNLTRDLASFIEQTHFPDLPEHVIDQAKVCVLDWLGVALAGSRDPPARIATSLIRELRGRSESTIIGTDLRTSCINAALVNGILGHAIELDDIHEQAILHPAAPVLPAVLAVAERCGSSGVDFLTSVVVGYEVEIRIGLAVNPSHYQYWHPTGTCGTFGAAAATSKSLGLNREQIMHALGIAGTQAAGLLAVFGTMSKPLNAGRAAQSGVLASLFAQKGFTSSTSVLDAPNGYLHATSQSMDSTRITEGLGDDYEILNTIFKRHASCGHTHGAIDALLALTTRYAVIPDNVETITVGTYPIAVDIVGHNRVPTTSFEGKFSLPYCLAIALLSGTVRVTDFSPEHLRDPTIHALSNKVTVHSDREFHDARLGCAWVNIRTMDGRDLYHRVDVPKGYPTNPLTHAELETKFTSLASLVLPQAQIEQLIQTINNLEQLDDMQELTALLRAS